MRYEDARPVPLEHVKSLLHLTAAPNWGYQLRRGLVALTADDAVVLRESMLPAVAG